MYTHTHTLDKLIFFIHEGFEKAAILNEMARMFVHSGDRHLASSAFNKSQEVELPVKDQPLKYEPVLVRHAINRFSFSYIGSV